jgi:hypothetical protein
VAPVKEPLRGAWWRRRNTGGVQRRVQRLVVPGSAGRRLMHLWLMIGRHGLLGLEGRPWAEHPRARGPNRHGPGLHKPSPRVIPRGPWHGGIGGGLMTAATPRGTPGKLDSRPFFLFLGRMPPDLPVAPTRVPAEPPEDPPPAVEPVEEEPEPDPPERARKACATPVLASWEPEASSRSR